MFRVALIVILSLLLIVKYMSSEDDCVCEDCESVSKCEELKSQPSSKDEPIAPKPEEKSDTEIEEKAIPKEDENPPLRVKNSFNTTSEDHVNLSDKVDYKTITKEMKEAERSIDLYEEDTIAKDINFNDKKRPWQKKVNGRYIGFIGFTYGEKTRKEYINLKISFSNKDKKNSFSGIVNILHYVKRKLVRIDVLSRSAKLRRDHTLVIKIPPTFFHRNRLNFNSNLLKLTGRFYYKSRFYKGSIKSCSKTCQNVGYFKLRGVN